MISSGPYADELMLSLEKIARPLTLVSRSCSSRSLMNRPADQDRPQAAKGARPARPLEDGPLGGDQLALVVPLLERLLEGPHDPDIGVAGALAAPLLTDFEEGIDPMVVGRLSGSRHGAKR